MEYNRKEKKRKVMNMKGFEEIWFEDSREEQEQLTTPHLSYTFSSLPLFSSFIFFSLAFFCLIFSIFLLSSPPSFSFLLLLLSYLITSLILFCFFFPFLPPMFIFFVSCCNYCTCLHFLPLSLYLSFLPSSLSFSLSSAVV